MAGTQTSVFGESGDYHFGPGKLYVNTSAGFVPEGFSGETGSGDYIGKTGPLEVSISSVYAEGNSIQTGSVMDDAAVSGQSCEINTTLKEASLDILETSIDGIVVERDTDSQPTQWGFVNVIGKRKRATAFQMTFVEINAGIDQWETPFLVLDFFKVFPMSDETTITIDAENFREVAVKFRAVASETDLDTSNRQAFFLSRVLATA